MTTETRLNECLDALTDIYKNEGQIWIGHLLLKNGREADWNVLNNREPDEWQKKGCPVCLRPDCTVADPCTEVNK